MLASAGYVCVCGGGVLLADAGLGRVRVGASGCVVEGEGRQRGGAWCKGVFGGANVNANAVICLVR